MKKIMTVALLGLFSAMALAAKESKDFDAKNVKVLNVKNSSGEIRISVSADAKAYVVADKIKFEKACELQSKTFGDELIVNVETGSFFGSWFQSGDCKVNLEIKVPRLITVNVKSGSGDVEVLGTTGAVDVSLGSGNIAIIADVSRLTAKVGSGSVKIQGLSGDANVKTGSGDVSLTYKSTPTKGDVDLKTGSGDAIVFVPVGTKLLSDFKAGSGKLYNEMGDTSEAGFKISMRAGSGDLSIKKVE